MMVEQAYRYHRLIRVRLLASLLLMEIGGVGSEGDGGSLERAHDSLFFADGSRLFANFICRNGGGGRFFEYAQS